MVVLAISVVGVGEEGVESGVVIVVEDGVVSGSGGGEVGDGVEAVVQESWLAPPSVRMMMVVLVGLPKRPK